MTSEQIDLIRGMRDGIRPESRMSVSEWSDLYRYLAPTASAEPGKWRTERTPYLREIMDRLSATDPCEEVVMMKGAQIGATELGFNWLGYIIDLVPAPTMIVQPTDEMCRRNSKIRFDPMVEATPRLRSKIRPKRSRDSGNTLLQKEFAGGVVIMTGANSGVGLRSMPVKYLFLDEVDAYPDDVDGEGSPVNLAMARTRTFARRKVFKCSTPTISGKSVIEREFEASDKRYFEVPCPHCGGFQPLKFSQLKWNDGEPESVYYLCIHCGQSIEERYKAQMLPAGQWIPSEPSKVTEKKAGYHLSSLYSPLGWYSWVEVVREFIESSKEVNRLKVFVNTVLGETWTEKGEAPPWEGLWERRERYPMNRPRKEVVFLTAGVDVQANRIEVEIVGWCRNKVTWSIDYRVLEGDTSSRMVWDKLSAIVSETWRREDGVDLPLRMMAIDTGYNTTHVYDFCRRFDPTRVSPVKGQDNQATVVGPPKYVDTSATGKKSTRLRLYHIGVSLLKSELYGYLKLHLNEDGSAPDGYCHFPEYGPEYFKGITAEQVEFKVIKGFKRYMWVKRFDRNEPLDCRNYARAAAAILGMDRWNDHQWDVYSLGTGVKSEQPAQKKKRSSSFWNR